MLNTKPDELAELREQGKRHLAFACSPARFQIERRVLFESLAASEEPCLWKLRSIAHAVFGAISVSLE